MSITTEMTYINFSYNGERHATTVDEATGFAESVHATSKKTSSLFSDIFVIRTIEKPSLPTGFVHNIYVATFRGPFLPPDFLKMMKFPKGISPGKWTQYMKKNARVAVLEPTPEAPQCPATTSRKRVRTQTKFYT